MRRARSAGPAPQLRRVHQSASIAQIVGLDAGERIAGAGLDQPRDRRVRDPRRPAETLVRLVLLPVTMRFAGPPIREREAADVLRGEYV